MKKLEKYKIAPQAKFVKFKYSTLHGQVWHANTPHMPHMLASITRSFLIASPKFTFQNRNKFSSKTE